MKKLAIAFCALLLILPSAFAATFVYGEDCEDLSGWNQIIEGTTSDAWKDNQYSHGGSYSCGFKSSVIGNRAYHYTSTTSQNLANGYVEIYVYDLEGDLGNAEYLRLRDSLTGYGIGIGKKNGEAAIVCEEAYDISVYQKNGDIDFGNWRKLKLQWTEESNSDVRLKIYLNDNLQGEQICRGAQSGTFRFNQIFIGQEAQALGGGDARVDDLKLYETCASHQKWGCYDDDVYWYTSCNELEDKKDECSGYDYEESYTYCEGNNACETTTTHNFQCMPWESTPTNVAECTDSFTVDNTLCNLCDYGCDQGVCLGQQTCSDGTPYSQCSITQPLYCDGGNLVDNCDICGCQADKQCQNNLCVDPSTGDLQAVEGFDAIAYASYQANYQNYRGYKVLSYWEYGAMINQYIEWDTASVPSEYNTGKVTFIWTGSNGIDAGDQDIYLNGNKILTFESNVIEDKVWTSGDYELFFDFKNHNSDNAGVYYFTVPASALVPGKQTLKVTGPVDSGTQLLDWVMVHTFTDTIDYETANGDLREDHIGKAGTTNDIEFEYGMLFVDSAQGWRTVDLLGTYTDPVVFMGPVSYDDSEPCHLRIRIVSPTSFQFMLEEWDYQDGVHAQEQVFYIVAESGVHNMSGIKMEAGKVSTNTNWKTVNLNQEFSTLPAVFAMPQTNVEMDAVVTRINNLAKTSFQVKLQEEENGDNLHATEEIGYIAFEPTINDDFEVGIWPNIASSWKQEAFYYERITPMLLAQMVTYKGDNTAGVRFRNLDEGDVEVFVEEEKSKDSEVSHVNENIAYLITGERRMDNGYEKTEFYTKDSSSRGYFLTKTKVNVGETVDFTFFLNAEPNILFPPDQYQWEFLEGYRGLTDHGGAELVVSEEGVEILYDQIKTYRPFLVEGNWLFIEYPLVESNECGRGVLSAAMQSLIGEIPKYGGPLGFWYSMFEAGQNCASTEFMGPQDPAFIDLNNYDGAAVPFRGQYEAMIITIPLRFDEPGTYDVHWYLGYIVGSFLEKDWGNAEHTTMIEVLP